MADSASTPAANFTAYGDVGGAIQWGTTTITGLATGKVASPGNYAGTWTLQVSGTYGGATWFLEGSNDGTTFFTLKGTDSAQTALTFGVGDKLLNVLERPRYVRIKTTGGTGTALTAILFCTVVG